MSEQAANSSRENDNATSPSLATTSTPKPDSTVIHEAASTPPSATPEKAPTPPSGGQAANQAPGEQKPNKSFRPGRKFRQPSGNTGRSGSHRNQDSAAAGGNHEDDIVFQNHAEKNLPPAPETLDLNELRGQSTEELLKLAELLGIDTDKIPRRKHDFIHLLVRMAMRRKTTIHVAGLLEVMPDNNYGFLRFAENSYLQSPGDIYVPPHLIRQFRLQTGDALVGTTAPPKNPNERYIALSRIETRNGKPPSNQPRHCEDFEDRTPIFPCEQLRMELGNGSTQDISAKIIDLISPIGKGQRGLIVAAPKAGKTMMLENIANSITTNHPECHLIVLLIDERPEEVTEMQRCVKGEVISSTFDESAARHVQVAEMVIAKAKRMVESGKDVVIILDSITRLARAYNAVTPSSGRVMTGGVDANALQRPKRFFGAARNLDEGGSLTILASTLIDTGSKMDDLIYEEFKGTGNAELHLNRDLAQLGIYPAVNIKRSGTRREDLIVPAEQLQKMLILRKYLITMDEAAGLEFLIERLKHTKTIEELFRAMKNT